MKKKAYVQKDVERKNLYIKERMDKIKREIDAGKRCRDKERCREKERVRKKEIKKLTSYLISHKEIKYIIECFFFYQNLLITLFVRCRRFYDFNNKNPTEIYIFFFFFNRMPFLFTF